MELRAGRRATLTAKRKAHRATSSADTNTCCSITTSPLQVDGNQRQSESASPLLLKRPYHVNRLSHDIRGFCINWHGWKYVPPLTGPLALSGSLTVQWLRLPPGLQRVLPLPGVQSQRRQTALPWP